VQAIPVWEPIRRLRQHFEHNLSAHGQAAEYKLLDPRASINAKLSAPNASNLVSRDPAGNELLPYPQTAYRRIRKLPSGVLSGSSARTARSMVTSFPFLCTASPNK